jgi:hypothetical protein
MKSTILTKVLDFYVSSRDYNGISVNTLFNNIGKSDIKILKDLVLKGLININWGFPHSNIHIQAYPPLPIEEQITWLNKLKLSELKSNKPPIFKAKGLVILSSAEKDFCIYPTKKALKRRVKQSQYKRRPFNYLLALGEPQLKPLFFELSILDEYINDPRYRFTSTGLDGSIHINNAHLVPQKDKLYVEHFGYGIKLDKNKYERSVAVFLCDLVSLSPNQQQRWVAKLIKSKKFFLHPEYDRMSRGHFALKLSIFQAFKDELSLINKMFEAAFGKKLFKQSEFEDSEISNFHFITRPTKKEYYEFFHLLDKLISDNIDKSFFDQSFRESVKSKNNKIEPGTLLLLEKWLEKSVRFTDAKPKVEMFSTFRKIRKERNKPGHDIGSNEWNIKYWAMQRKLISEAYSALRTLRLIITNHPKAKSVVVPDYLYKGEICDY